jgi:hypothetical protein
MRDTIQFRIKNQDDPFYKALRQRVSAYLLTQPAGRYGNCGAFQVFKNDGKVIKTP